MLVDGDVVEPAVVRLGADEREQRRAVDVGGLSPAGDRRPLQRRLAGERGDGAADVDLHPRVGFDAVDQVGAHRRRQRPAHDDADRRGLLGQEHRRLAGRVAAADHDDRQAVAGPGFELGGGVVDAGHLVAVEVGDRQLAVVGAGGSDDGPAGDLRAVAEAGDEVAGDVVESR